VSVGRGMAVISAPPHVGGLLPGDLAKDGIENHERPSLTIGEFE